MSMYTPQKMIRKPQRSRAVSMAFVMLKPWKRTNEAVRTAVVNVT